MSAITRRIVASCKKSGAKCTAKRLMVADYLQRFKDYTCANNLYLVLRNDDVKISYAMVYLALGWLTQNGFIEIKEESGRTGKKFRIKR